MQGQHCQTLLLLWEVNEVLFHIFYLLLFFSKIHLKSIDFQTFVIVAATYRVLIPIDLVKIFVSQHDSYIVYQIVL